MTYRRDPDYYTSLDAYNAGVQAARDDYENHARHNRHLKRHVCKMEGCGRRTERPSRICHTCATRAHGPDAIPAVKLCALAGISYRELHTWTRSGYLQALPRQEGARQGTPHYYHRDQVPLARVMKVLTSAGIRVGIAHRVAAALVDNGQAQLGAGVTVALTGRTWATAITDTEDEGAA